MFEDFNIDLEAFIDSLVIMGIGMLGIFIVIAVIMGAMYLLTGIFKDKGDKK